LKYRFSGAKQQNFVIEKLAKELMNPLIETVLSIGFGERKWTTLFYQCVGKPQHFCIATYSGCICS
jgi:hypothetical protein